MRSNHNQKIDLNQEYPCPCRRHGRLKPIALTEALGCDRCQQIFVVQDNKQVIEQLTSTYPYKKSWYWTGNHWKITHSGLSDKYLSIIISLIMLIPVLFLIILLKLSYTSSPIMFAIVIILILLFIVLLMYWLTYRS